jgi:hypothetical protein
MLKLLLTTVLIAGVSVPAAAKNESLESLKARAASADSSQQVELFTRVAELQLEQLSVAYEQGNPEQVEAALHDILEYGLKAAKSSQDTGKRMKQTEIAIRKIANRLEDIRKTLSFEERQPVATAIERLESARTDLLHHMFKKKK